MNGCCHSARDIAAWIVEHDGVSFDWWIEEECGDTYVVVDWHDQPGIRTYTCEAFFHAVDTRIDSDVCPECGYEECRCLRVDVDEWIVNDADARRYDRADEGHDDR